MKGIRSSTIYTLKTIGKDDQRVVDKFIELLDDPTLGEVLCPTCTTSAIAAPAVQIDQDAGFFRPLSKTVCLSGTRRNGLEAKDALPALEKATKDSDASVP